MSILNKLSLKIKRRENCFFSALYDCGKSIYYLNIPYFRPLSKLLLWERYLRIGIWRWFLRVFYYTPLFKAKCHSSGRNLCLINGLPYIGENLRFIIGSNVTIYGDAGFEGYKLLTAPLLEIGDHTFIGPQVRIGVGKEIRIGKYCLIAARVFICDHDGHPLDWQKRREKLPVDKQDIKSIIIEDDAWIGEGAFICKGVKIGKGAIIGARSVVTEDVPEFTVVAGNPARIIKNLAKIAPEGN